LPLSSSGGRPRISGVPFSIADDYPKVLAQGPSENSHLRRINDDSVQILRGDPYAIDLGPSKISSVQYRAGELCLPQIAAGESRSGQISTGEISIRHRAVPKHRLPE
jgi:hypothetical protein